MPERWQAVVNQEGQYSVWPAERKPPSGWQASGMAGTRRECLDWIEASWTDMRPRSLQAAREARETAANH